MTSRRVHVTYLAILAAVATASIGVGWAVEPTAPLLDLEDAAELVEDIRDGRPGVDSDVDGTVQAGVVPRVAVDAPSASVDTLPAPFDGWSVVVEEVADLEGVHRVSFDSPLLGLRETAIVWLPGDYEQAPADHAWPTVLYLHGTRGTRLHPDVDEVTRELARAGLSIPFASPATGPANSPTSPSFDETQDLHDFVVVAPDSGPLPWCTNCNWVDNIGEMGFPSDTYLHQELLPLVSALYGTRTDRAGVGVVGHSMGGGGALIQGFLHPDRFAFAGSSSGTLSTWDDPASVAQVRWAYWNRLQGFDPPLVNEVPIRNFNLLDIAANVVGVGTELVAVIGDACLDPATSSQGSCADVNPLTDSGNFAQEVYQRYGNHDLTAARLVQAGVPITLITREGNHGIFDSTFRRHFLDRLNATFTDPPETPDRFAYRTATTSFDIWGWQVEVARPNDEFLHLSDARTDGRSVLISGSGVVTLTSPAVFSPGSVHEVVVTPAGQAPEIRDAIADGDGRLQVVVDLGVTNDLDERDVLTDLGAHPMRQARVEVDP